MANEPVREDTGGTLSWLDRETLLDLTVNFVPLVILLFFSVFYTVIYPWDADPARFALMHVLTLFPFLVLAILTYYAGKVVSRDERRLEE